ncbi:tRNA (adenine-N1)-methyltransferase [Calditerrivibrio nitroreducens]|uniref:tRNA (adenine(58)-N(1))-methyltransferase TrmI n=1 Tax=Calditerrivibrio nitroreducens (strain DSM 19672 / NBRC 101217 / Yu37-1) TaxID=768670 RepID=E4TGI2_CALNY|nr:tRNA (adenine-N1)-methyltransferase [Calditerrivibrio nitroreducens]ADR18663.1 tRNA (adenine-58-N(1)-) methyltransferase [Calditerrivibrio nitroreducens DSM 19672]
MLKYGDKVILTDHKKNKHTVTLKEGGKFSTNYGYIEHDKIIEAGNGGIVLSSKNIKYTVLKPTYIDYVMHIKRNAQIIYPKDTAAMLMEGDVYPGLEILESGIGQGAFSIALLRALAGKGHLVSYEIREDFAEQSARFIKEFLGDVDNHTIRIGNIYEGFEGVYDRVFLDLPEPWHVLKYLKDGLRDGGIVVAYIPTVLQLKTFVDTLKELNYFADIESFELIKRPWKVDGLSVRPEMWIYNHSAFICRARKMQS